MPPSLLNNKTSHNMPICFAQNYPHSPCTVPVGKQRQISHFVPVGPACGCPSHQSGSVQSSSKVVSAHTNAPVHVPIAFQPQFGGVVFTGLPPPTTCVSCANASTGNSTNDSHAQTQNDSVALAEPKALRSDGITPNVCNTTLTKEQRTWSKEGWRRQPRLQMFVSIFFFHCCASIMTFTMNFVHLRMPDPHKNEPLADLLHDLVPMQNWGHTAELCMWISILSGWFTGIYVLGPYMARPTIRFALAWGSTWLLRSFIMLSTTLPPTDDYFCRHNYPNYPHDFPHPIGSVARNTMIGIATFGYGNVHCGDLMFSGHTTSLVLSVLFCYTYCRPYAPKWLFPLSVCAAIMKAFLMVAQRDHYTADVLVSAFASISFWHFAPERFPYLPGTTISFLTKSLKRASMSTCEATDSASREAENQYFAPSSNHTETDTQTQSVQRSNSQTRSLLSNSSPVNGGHSPDPERSHSVASYEGTPKLRTRARPPAPRVIVGNRGRSLSSPRSGSRSSHRSRSQSPNTSTTPHTVSSLQSNELNVECSHGTGWDGRAMNATHLGGAAPTLIYQSRCACGNSQAPVVYVALAPPAYVVPQRGSGDTDHTKPGTSMPRGMRGHTRRGGCQFGSPVNAASPPASPITTSSVGAVRR